MITLTEMYGPNQQYAIISRYVDDDCIWMGYKKIYDMVDGYPKLNLDDPIEVRAEHKSSGLFLVSLDGKIFSTRTKRLLSTRITKQGYEVVSSRLGGRNGKCILVKVHRAVAIAFLGYCPELVVNHIDCNKTNNHVSNLEWVTQLDNTIHAAINGLMTRQDSVYRSTILTSEQVDFIKSSQLSGRRLGKVLGISRHVIDRVRDGRKSTLVFDSNKGYSNMACD